MELDKNTMTIAKVFYEHKSSYLNELYRQTGVSKPTILKILKALTERGILKQRIEANSKIYFIDLNNSLAQKIFGLFDLERVEKLDGRRKRALSIFKESIITQPYFILLFGSTAKGEYSEKSDVDLIVVYQKVTKKVKAEIENARFKVESVTGIKFQVFALSQEDFKSNLNTNGSTVKSAMESGFPIFGHEHFYGVFGESYGIER